MAATGGTCPNCGTNVAEGARFCGHCGAAIPEQLTCARCGTPMRPDARFCGACGAAATGAEGPPQTSRRPAKAGMAKPWIAVAGGGVAVALAVFGAWFLFLRGGGDEDGSAGDATGLESTATITEPVAEDAVDLATGLPLRPGVQLAHPQGAAASIPSGPALYGDMMDLRTVALDEDPWWDHGGQGWEFVSWAGVPVTGTATVDIPAPNGGALIAWTAAGRWVELPALEVTLANGSRGLRASVSEIPAPWTFAVATARAEAPPLSTEDQEDLRVELLYWTDREAWEAETLAWLATDPASTPLGLDELAAAVPERGAPFASSATFSQDPAEQVMQHYNRLYRQLNLTRRLLGGARLGLTVDPGAAAGIPLPGVAMSAQGLYAAGIQRLVKVREAWLELRPDMELARGRYDYKSIMDKAIEATMADYTPWGLELVASLIEDTAFSGLNLRVLVPYGELAWADVVLSPEMVPAVEAHVAATVAGVAEYRYATPQTQLSLRFYSTRAIERLAIIDTLKGPVGSVVRWLPVALAAVGIVPGSVGLSAAFATFDQLIDYAQTQYDTQYGGGPYAYMAFEGFSAGGIGGTSFIMDMLEEQALMSLEGRPMLPSHGLTIAQFAYSVGVYAAVRNTDWYFWRSIREVSEGTRGYCGLRGCSDLLSSVIPPVMVHARVAGPLVQLEDSYPASVVRLMGYRLDHRGDLHTGWLEELNNDVPVGPLEAMTFLPYREDTWPGAVVRTQPDHQAITLQIPKSSIPDEVRQGRPIETPLAEFEPVLYLEGANGELVTVPITDETELEGGAAPDTFYTTVVLRGPKQTALDSEKLALFPPLFRPSPDQQAVFEIPGTTNSGLRTKLKGSLLFKAAADKRLLFEVDFTQIPVRKIPGQEVRVNYALATTSGGRVLYKGTTSQGLAIEIAIDEDANRWEIVRWDVLDAKRPPRTGTGSCGDDEVGSVGLPASKAQQEAGLMEEDEYELAKWLFSGPLQDDRLARGPLPPGFNPAEVTLEQQKLLGPFGTRSVNRAQIAGDVVVPFSDFWGCPAIHLTYTATRQ
ncbi:MAG: zinc ribbon domain-containing protein [Dehalococcoidia bacterium]|nr:zinc ribbon domain-containing protein [Dehalococcoidia bacterium]